MMALAITELHVAKNSSMAQIVSCLVFAGVDRGLGSDAIADDVIRRLLKRICRGVSHFNPNRCESWIEAFLLALNTP